MAATQADVDNAVKVRNEIITRGSSSYAVEGIQYTALDLEKLDRTITRMRGEVRAATGRHSHVAEFGKES